MHLTTVDGIADHGAHRRGPPERGSAFCLYAALIEPVCDAVATIALVYDFVVDFRLDRSFFLVANQIPYRSVLFVHATKIHSVKTEGHEATAIFPRQHHLLLLGANADRGLFRFAGRLPETDVIEQLIHMAVESLLAFLDAPDADSMRHEPLHHERCFIIAAAKAVEHEYQQNIEFPCQRIRLDLHDGVSVFGFDLVAGHTLLIKLLDDLPSSLGLHKFPTGNALHGDVVVIYLTNR